MRARISRRIGTGTWVGVSMGGGRGRVRRVAGPEKFGVGFMANHFWSILIVLVIAGAMVEYWFITVPLACLIGLGLYGLKKYDTKLGQDRKAVELAAREFRIAENEAKLKRKMSLKPQLARTKVPVWVGKEGEGVSVTEFADLRPAWEPGE